MTLVRKLVFAFAAIVALVALSTVITLNQMNKAILQRLKINSSELPMYPKAKPFALTLSWFSGSAISGRNAL